MTLENETGRHPHSAPPSSSCDDGNQSIENLDASGGTDIAAGIQKAIDEYDAKSGSDRAKIAILLTDGHAPRDPARAAAQQAASKDIVIHTIGLRNADGVFLRDIAQTTGGTYNQVQDPSDLPEVFSRVANDTKFELNDGDELCDRLEEEGLPVLIWSQPVLEGASDGSVQKSGQMAETDGDKLPDDEEILPDRIVDEVNIPGSTRNPSNMQPPAARCLN